MLYWNTAGHNYHQHYHWMEMLCGRWVQMSVSVLSFSYLVRLINVCSPKIPTKFCPVLLLLANARKPSLLRLLFLIDWSIFIQVFCCRYSFHFGYPCFLLVFVLVLTLKMLVCSSFCYLRFWLSTNLWNVFSATVLVAFN